MKKIFLAALVVIGCAVQIESASATQVEDSIKEVLGKLDRCFAANDTACVGELFVDDATYVAPQGDAKVIKGRAQIVKVLAPAMDSMNKRGGKLTHALENVRMIDDAHAFIDVTITVRGPKGPAKEEEGAHRDLYRGVGVMALKGGKWLCEDLRSYVIGYTAQGPSEDNAKSAGEAQKEAAPPAESAPTPPSNGEPASPTQG